MIKNPDKIYALVDQIKFRGVKNIAVYKLSSAEKITKFNISTSLQVREEQTKNYRIFLKQILILNSNLPLLLPDI